MAHHESRQRFAEDETHIGGQIVAVDALSTGHESAEGRLALGSNSSDEEVHVLCGGQEGRLGQMAYSRTGRVAGGTYR